MQNVMLTLSDQSSRTVQMIDCPPDRPLQDCVDILETLERDLACPLSSIVFSFVNRGQDFLLSVECQVENPLHSVTIAYYSKDQSLDCDLTLSQYTKYQQVLDDVLDVLREHKIITV